MERNRFIYTVIGIIALLFFSCDSYNSRKKLIEELSSLYNNNLVEFKKIQEYFSSDSLSRFIEFRYQDHRIEITLGDNSLIIDSINQMKTDPDVFQILTFMQKERIRSIYGYGKEGGIKIFFKDNKFPCFNFWYRSDFYPEDEDVKQQIENIKDSRKKAWIYVLDKKGWYIKGVPCFS